MGNLIPLHTTSESKNVNSNKAKDKINLYAQGEIIFLIVIAILVQIIILYKPKE